MPVQLNPLLSRLKASPTLRINEDIRALQAAGEDIVHFGFGQSPFPVCPAIVDEMARHAGNKDYLPAQGLPALREAVAAYFSPLLDREVDPDLVFIGPGSKTNLFHTFYCHAGPLVFGASSWVSYGPQARVLGKPFNVLPPHPENHYKLSPEDLDEQLEWYQDGHQAMLVLNSPNNPSGAVYDEAELAAIAATCRKHGCLVLSDEIYGAVTYDEVYRSIARDYPEGTIVSSGMSKAFSAGGYRLGVLILPEELRNLRSPLNNMATETFSSVTSAVQHAALLAYSRDEGIEAYVRDCTEIHGVVGRYTARHLREGGVLVDDPRGAFYLFPDFEDFRERAELRDSDDLADKLLHDCGVATLPGTAFFVPGNHLNVRISPVDYDGGAALEAYRARRGAGGELDEDAFVQESTPRVAEGVRRLLSLGG